MSVTVCILEIARMEYRAPKGSGISSAGEESDEYMRNFRYLPRGIGAERQIGTGCYILMERGGFLWSWKG